MKHPLWIIVYMLYTLTVACSAEQVTDDTLFHMSDNTKSIIGYDGTLICPNRDKFCALIYYIEDDTHQPSRLSSFDEDLKMVPLQCTHNGTLYHNAHVKMEGHDGIFGGAYYEPYVTIYHDCWGGERCKNCINEIRRAQAFLEPVHKQLMPWRRRKWTLTLDPHGYRVPNDAYLEPLREHYFPGQQTRNRDLNQWIAGTEVFDREHLLKDDSLRFDDEIKNNKLTLLG